jgi:hypothetical protein
MDDSVRRQAGTVVSKGRGGQVDQIGALGKADRPPGPPVHGDGMIWVNAANGLCRLTGVEMALTKCRSPASDWQQGEVDVRHFLECKVRTCVSRIPAPAGALDKKAERGSAVRAPRVSPTIVVRGQGAYPQTAKLYEITRFNLAELHTASGDWLKQRARTSRGDENRRGWDQSKRRQMGVVGV